MSDASSSPVVQPKPQPVPWNPWLGMLFIIGIFYGSQFLAGIMLSLIPLFTGWSEKQTNTWFDANSILLQFAVILLSTVFTLLITRWFLKLYKLDFGFLGLKKPKWYEPLLGLGMVPAYYIVFGMVVAIVSHFVPSFNVSQKQEIGFDDVAGQTEMIVTFVSLVILAPLLEEIVFRGFIYKTLRTPFAIPVAAVVTSLLFGAGHLLEGGSDGLLYVGALQTFILSLFLVGLRQKTHNLWPGITLHASNNLIAFLALYVFHTA